MSIQLQVTTSVDYRLSRSIGKS